MHVVAGKAASNAKLVSTIAALSYYAGVGASNFRPEKNSIMIIMTGII